VRLYDFLPSGNGYKVRLAPRWLGIPFEYREIDILNGESHTPWFLLKNPFGQIPLLELDDGTCLRESGSILLYLTEGTPLLPDDKLLRARGLEWMGYEQTHVDGVISRARFRRMFPHAIATREEEFAAWYAEGRGALGVLDVHLRDRRFLVDERFTVADIALHAYVHRAEEGGFDLSAYPSLPGWFERVRSQRGYVPIGQVPR
jgi:glutathione S-transferase